VSAGVHSVVSIRQSGSTGTFFQGLAVWSSTAPKVELLNVGIGGSFTVSLDVTNPPPQYNYGQMEAAYALTPQLALLKFATNDIANNTTLNTTGSNTTVEQMAINYQQGITSMKEAGVDPVIVISEPLASANYATLMPAWRAAAVQLAYANNVPLIDLSATYENDFNALPHLDALHPNEQGYIDMAQTFNRFFESLP
jgi:lysophospholipase L1-like esterase